MPSTKTKFLLTGNSGFLGKAISSYLSKNGFEVEGMSRSNADRMIDLSKQVPGFETSYDMVIHCAGKAHVVPKTATEKQLFFDINYKGTLHLLQGLEKSPKLPQSFIFISTIAVYGKEEGIEIGENHPLNGTSPYAKSKIQAEEAVKDWCEKHGINFVILRLPLIAGENPPGNLGAIRKAIQKGFYFKIKSNLAKKSIVLATDVAALIPSLFGKKGIYNLTDGIHPTFQAIEIAIEKATGKKVLIILPYWLVSLLAKMGDILSFLKLPSPLNSNKLLKMTASLTFSDEKAREELAWSPNAVIPFIEKHF